MEVNVQKSIQADKPLKLVVRLPFVFLVCFAHSIFAGGHDGIHVSLDLATGLDSNVTRAKYSQDIISDRFVSLDLNLNKDFPLSGSQVAIASFGTIGKKLQFTDQMDEIGVYGGLQYRWQNRFGFLSPFYEINTKLTEKKFNDDSRNSLISTTQLFFTKRITDAVTTSSGYEFKYRDSNGSVYDNNQHRFFLNLDYVWDQQLAFYGTYSFIQGDTISSAQRIYCNGVFATDIFPFIQESTALEQDNAFNQDYCGQWVSYRLDATTNMFWIGANYGLSHSIAVDLSLAMIKVSANADINYSRNIFQTSFLLFF